MSDALLRHERLQRVTIWVLAAGVFALVVMGAYALIRPEPFDPLDWELQIVETLTDDGVTVVPLVEGFDQVPAIMKGEPVPVRAEFNVTADGPVDVSGTVVWVSLDQPGLRCRGVFADGTPFENIPNTLDPGEHVERFNNAMPICVSDQVTTPQLWQIRGEVDVLAAHAVGSTWATEPFWIVS